MGSFFPLSALSAIRRSGRLIQLVVLCAALCGGSPWAGAQDAEPPVPTGIEDHSWSRFGIGSWKRVRISKEVFGGDGKLESMTVRERKTTLTAVTADRFTLHEEVTLEVAGKLFPPSSRQIERGLFNETEDQVVNTRRLSDGKVVIGGHEFPTQIHQVTLADEKSVWTSTVHFSPNVEPFVLKRHTISTDPTGNHTNYEAHVEVVAFDMPHRVLAEIKPTAHLKTVHRQGDVTTITLEVSCPSVPGHIVAHSTKMVSAEGRLMERSILELLEYEVGSKQVEHHGLGRTRLFGKRRLRGNPR